MLKIEKRNVPLYVWRVKNEARLGTGLAKGWAGLLVTPGQLCPPLGRPLLPLMDDDLVVASIHGSFPAAQAHGPAQVKRSCSCL